MSNRRSIYYWKSDRPYFIGNVQNGDNANVKAVEQQLKQYLLRYFRDGELALQPAGGQGNHITYLARYTDQTYFVRIENGPEHDDYMEVETEVLKKVRELGIPAPVVFHSDSTRLKVPFAIQVLEYIGSKDLNILEKTGALDTVAIASKIGMFIAKWQVIRPEKYGLFNPLILKTRHILEGYHATYKEYFLLNWDTHLSYLLQSGFLCQKKVGEIKELVNAHDCLLDIGQGCLVHKDLALWNILGDQHDIHAFIDWNDAVSGDPADDLSLLGCFYPGDVVLSAIEGYASIKQLPCHFEKRLWLHLLRNIIFKSVIRVKGNYFSKPDSFFMKSSRIGSLEQFTLNRISTACEGLKGTRRIADL